MKKKCLFVCIGRYLQNSKSSEESYLQCITHMPLFAVSCLVNLFILIHIGVITAQVSQLKIIFVLPIVGSACALVSYSVRLSYQVHFQVPSKQATAWQPSPPPPWEPCQPSAGGQTQPEPRRWRTRLLLGLGSGPGMRLALLSLPFQRRQAKQRKTAE